jgi:chemotaxis signal transduction protein
MSTGDAGGTAERLREAFDRSFGEAQGAPQAAFDDLLAITVGGDPHVLRLADIQGLHANHAVVPVPSPDRRFIGIAGFRNTVAPIFDLRLVLGYPPGAPARWLVLARGPVLVGLAFDRFDGHRRVPRAQLAAGVTGEKIEPGVRGAVTVDGLVRPLIQMSAVLAAIAKER